MKPVKVGILGLGTVGGGTVNVLKRNAAEISRRAGREIIIKRASAKDLSKIRICDTQGIILSSDPISTLFQITVPRIIFTPTLKLFIHLYLSPYL